MSFSIIVAFLFFSTVALADSFDVEIDYPTQMFADSMDFVKISVTNNEGSDWFSVSEFSAGSFSKWFINSDFTRKINSGETVDFVFELDVPKDATPFTYQYSIIVKKDGETVEKELNTEILERTYTGIVSDIDFNCVSCKGDLEVSVGVKNIGSGDLNNVDLVLEVDGNKKRIALGDLNSKEEVFETANFELVGKGPGDYNMEADLFIDGKLSDHDSKMFSIPVYQDVDVERDITQTPIGAFVTLKAINNGNMVDDAKLDDVVEGKWWISYLGPDPERKDGTGWTWFATLLPTEEQNVSYVLLYWPVPILAILLVVGGAMGYLQLTGAHIKKDIHRVGDELKISLHVRNLGGILEGCVVRDIVPNSFILPKDFGTLKPIVRKTAHGTELLWRVGNMRTGEERLVNYSIIPRTLNKMSITLPAASVKGIKNEKTIISVSKPGESMDVGTEEHKLKFTVAE